MRTLYLSDHVSVSISDLKIRIQNGSDRREWNPLEFPYDAILIERGFGYVSFAALRVLLSLGVSVALLNYQGQILGHMAPYSRRSGDVQTRQYRAVNDPARRLRIAKSVATKGYRRRGLSPPFSLAGTLPELVRMESRAADGYWAGWSERLKSAWPDHDFDGRDNPRYHTRIRASTRVNAALNYSYALLESACRTTIHRVGMSPLHGFLHVTQTHDAEPLVYDFEEWGRAWVDSAVLDWFSKPANRRGFARDGWLVRLPPEKVPDLVRHVSARIDTAQLVRDAREIVRRL